MEEVLHLTKICLWFCQVSIIGIIICRIIQKNLALKKAGNKIIQLNKSKYPKIEYIVIIILVINLFIFLINDLQIIDIITIICSSIILLYLNMKLYKTSNGIYEFGIIFKKYHNWDKIFSYHYSQNNTVSFFINTREKTREIIININENDCEKINKLMEKNNIIYKNI